jgi:hypothetical protein
LEDLADLGRPCSRCLLDQVIGLGDQLHVGVLDAVVDHLDEVAGAVRPDVGAARLTVDLRRNALQERTQRLVGLARTTGHDRRTIQRTLLTAGDTGADEVQTVGLEFGFAADRVREVRVAGVDDDVAFLQQGDQLVDHRVRAGSRFHHDQYAARPLQGRHEVGQRRCRNKRALRPGLGHQRLGPGVATVVDGHAVAVASEVPR